MRTSAATTRLVCSTSASWHNSRDRTFSWRGGRAVECAGLENRKAERPREFESHPLRVRAGLAVSIGGRDSTGLKSRDCGIQLQSQSKTLDNALASRAGEAKRQNP